MTRIWMRPLSLAIPEPVGGELDRLARDAHRRPPDQAALLLIDAIERASTGGDASLTAMVEAFETEGHHAFSEADSPSAGLVRSLVLQARGEAWLQAAMRLRGATAPIEVPHVEPRAPMG